MSDGATREHRARIAPAPRPLVGVEELSVKLADLLRSDYVIDRPAPFMAFFEGTTDVRYAELAVKLEIAAGAGDLLKVPSGVAQSKDERIALCTPLKPGSNRGGVPQMVRLAEELRPYVFLLQSFGGVVFVFDGDQAGSEAVNKLTAMGYSREQHIVTLSKDQHPDACGDRGLVIEDLLSLRIQKSFFDMGGASCEAVFLAGELVRFRWHHDSKSALSGHVSLAGEREDVVEIARLVRRIRAIVGFG